jgi:hypothetical protein
MMSGLKLKVTPAKIITNAFDDKREIICTFKKFKK